jgi:hypothetical protein
MAESSYFHPLSLEKNWNSVKESLLEVKIFYSSFDVVVVEEQPRHDVSIELMHPTRISLTEKKVARHVELNTAFFCLIFLQSILSVASDIGGALGLLLGLCGMNLIEITFLLWDIIAYKFCRTTNTKEASEEKMCSTKWAVQPMPQDPKEIFSARAFKQ